MILDIKFKNSDILPLCFLIKSAIESKLFKDNLIYEALQKQFFIFFNYYCWEIFYCIETRSTNPYLSNIKFILASISYSESFSDSRILASHDTNFSSRDTYYCFPCKYGSTNFRYTKFDIISNNFQTV